METEKRADRSTVFPGCSPGARTCPRLPRGRRGGRREAIRRDGFWGVFGETPGSAWILGARAARPRGCVEGKTSEKARVFRNLTSSGAAGSRPPGSRAMLVEKVWRRRTKSMARSRLSLFLPAFHPSWRGWKPHPRKSGEACSEGLAPQGQVNGAAESRTSRGVGRAEARPGGSPGEGRALSRPRVGRAVPCPPCERAAA